MEGKPVFVTDIDSVLLDISTPLENAVAELYGCPDAYGFMHSLVGMWDLNLAFGLPQSEMDRVWDKAFSTPNLPYPGAKLFVSELQRRGYFVLGITKRGGPRFVEPAKRDIPILGLDQYIFADNHQQKGPVLAKWVQENHNEGLGYPRTKFFLDDKIGNIQSVQETFRGITSMLMSQPWNTSLDLKVPYTRVETYTQILDIVDAG